MSPSTDIGRLTERSPTERTGCATGGAATGGANLDTGYGSGVCTGGADIEVSHEIPEFIGKTSGIGAYAVRCPARRLLMETAAAAATASTRTATMKIKSGNGMRVASFTTLAEVARKARAPRVKLDENR